jgi:hypothetical protein
MGDTCWLKIELKRSDLPKFREILNREEDWWDERLNSGDNAIVICIVNAAGDGWVKEIKQFADAGLSFLIEYASGKGYGPGVYVGYAGDIVECNSDMDGTPVVQVREAGIDHDSLKICIRYWEEVAKVREYFQED